MDEIDEEEIETLRERAGPWKGEEGEWEKRRSNGKGTKQKVENYFFVSCERTLNLKAFGDFLRWTKVPVWFF